MGRGDGGRSTQFRGRGRPATPPARTGALLLFALVLSLGFPLPAAAQQDPAALQRIHALIQQQGRARVLVELRLPGGGHAPEGHLSSAAATVQRQDITTVGAAVAARVHPTGSTLRHRYASLPYVAFDVDAAGLARLNAAPLHVARIFEDRRLSPALYASGPLVQADQTAARGFDGSGWTVAIIDDGIDKTHPFLAGKVVSEACYVSGNGCPNGLSTQTGAGAGVPFPNSLHGTHVAGIVAGNGSTAVPLPSPMMSGVARGAQLIAINVFGPHAEALFSDVLAAMDRVYFLRSTLNIAAVNLSLGIPNEPHSSPCDMTEGPMKTAIDQLRSVNIATVIASGDDGFTNGLSSPSCISSAISVGSTTKSDAVSSFSNVSAFLSLHAPGSNISSSTLAGRYASYSGTSMSTPHVAGAWAVLRQASPTATVSQILAALRASGVPVTDTQSGGTVTVPRIAIKDAMALLAPTPTSVSPATGTLGATLSVTIAGNNFSTGPTVSFGAGVTVNSTTFVSSTQLTASITIAANATSGTRTVTVTSPDGASGSLPDAFTVGALRPEVLSMSPGSASAFGPGFTLTVTGSGFTNSSPVVQVNGSPRPTTVVSATKLTAIIPASDLATTAANLAITARFTAPGGSTLTSATGYVKLSQPSLTVSATTSPLGGSITATLSDGPGGSTDWLALSPVGAATTSYLQWTYVGAGVTTRTWTVTMPTTVGNYEFRLYLNNGYTVAATSPAVNVVNINPTPSITALSPASIVAGSAAFKLTVTGTGFVSGATATVGGQARTVTFVSATQVDVAVTASDVASPGPVAVQVTNPPNCVSGQCASSTVNLTVTPPPPPPGLAVSATTSPPGGSITVTLSNSPGGSTDWLGLAQVGSVPTSYVQWTYVGAGVTTRTWTVTMPNTVGSYEFRLYLNNGYAVAATSPAVAITNPTPSITALSPASLAAGAPAFTLSVTGTGFVSGATATVGGQARSVTFVSTTQVTVAVTAADVASPGPVAVQVSNPAPCVGGQCASSTVNLTVTPPPPPPGLAVSATTSPPGASITATLSNSPGGSTDWLALSPVGAAATSYLQWTYVGAGVTTRTWTVTMPTTLGGYEFRLYLNNGFTVAATSPAVNVANINATPSITALNPPSVAAGSPAFTLTVTGTGFVAGATATVGGVARTLTFVSATQVTVAVTAPDVASQGTPGIQVTNPPSCVSSQCASNTASFTVTAPPPPPTLTSINPTSAGVGVAAFTLTATGADFAGNSVVQVNGSPRPTTFVSPTQLNASIPASDLAVAGTLSITVFTPAPGGGTSTAQPLTLIGPSLAVSTTATLGLQTVTTTLSNSPGNPTDWLALAVVGSPDTSYLQFTYVGAGVVNRTWTVTMPNAGGPYEFRLYLNNGFTVAGRSPAVVVTQDLRGTYTIASTVTQTACSNPQNNGTFSMPGTLTITSQSGGNFLGTGVLNTSIAGLLVQMTITITSGSVTPPQTPPASAVSAAFTFATTVNFIPSTSGSGTLIGLSIPNRITGNINAQTALGETCLISGPVSATK